MKGLDGIAISRSVSYTLHKFLCHKFLSITIAALYFISSGCSSRETETRLESNLPKASSSQESSVLSSLDSSTLQNHFDSSSSHPKGSKKLQKISSDSGYYKAYPLTVEVPESGMTTHIILHDVRRNQEIIVDPNPGGFAPPTVNLKFVVSDNLIASWGCGTQCQSAALISPGGDILASLSMHSVSPNKELAVTFAGTSLDRNIRFIDLQTGKTIEAFPVPETWGSVCSASWAETSVTLQPCYQDEQSVQLNLPR
jgi:hypothetical protein